MNATTRVRKKIRICSCSAKLETSTDELYEKKNTHHN